MSKLKLALMFGTAAALLASRPAAAADYIFTVPVDIRSLHPTVTTGIVVCVLKNARGTNVGDGVLQRFSLAAGSYRGDVEIRISTARGAEPVVGWACNLRFVVPGGSDLSAIVLSNPTNPLFREEFRRAPGSEFRPEVTGRF